MAVAALALAFANQFRYLWAAGAISLGFVVYFPYQVNRSVQEAMARFQEQYPGVDVSVATSGALAWHMGSGFYVMVAGAVLILVAALLDHLAGSSGASGS